MTKLAVDFYQVTDQGESEVGSIYYDNATGKFHLDPADNKTLRGILHSPVTVDNVQLFSTEEARRQYFILVVAMGLTSVWLSSRVDPEGWVRGLAAHYQGPYEPWASEAYEVGE
jgi:hypothetical protein